MTKSMTDFRMPGRWKIAAASTLLLTVVDVMGCGGNSDSGGGSGLPAAKASSDQVAHGRYLFTSMGCADCHANGIDDPSSPTWMAGYQAGSPNGKFQIGPFTTYCPNLTPDATGLGAATDRQVYNALKHGLDPGAPGTDVVISGDTPGAGGFPASPQYLAPPMPWPSTRHLTDGDLWSLVADIKHGVKAIKNTVPASSGPPDHWASSYTATAVGPVQLPAYPTGQEQFQP